MTRRGKRSLLVLGLVAGVGLAVGLVLAALQQNMSLFFSPAEVLSGKAPTEQVIRVGGLVETGSVKRGGEDLTVRFRISDGAAVLPVSYTGILPNLFSEGEAVVARGRLQPDGSFLAEEVLAKHDENYMPPEVAEALKQGKALPNPHSGGN